MGVTAGAANAGQTAEQQLAAAHQALLRTKGLQFDFKAIPVEPPPAWLEPLLRVLAKLAPVLKYVFWGGLALGAALILWLIIVEVAGTRFGIGKRRVAAAVDWRPDPGKAQALLDDADRLAGEGRFEEAIHILLYRSIDDLAGRRPGAVRPALTSRDIARLEVLPGEPRTAFARIAEAVERSFFGGRPVGRDDFARARSDCEAFAFSGAWR